jgi:hypothetical protein
MNQHIEQAIDNFRRSAVRYAKTERYYRGDHDLAFATEKFENAFGTLFREFAMNLCPAICDAVKDKLRISGFVVNAGPRTLLSASVARDADHAPPVGEAMPLSSLRSQLDHIWFRNRMQQRAGEIHKEALKNGDAYAVVWFDVSGEVTIYPHRAANVTVHYDEDSPGRIAWAAKYWRTADRHTLLNIFYPDRIKRYVTKKEFDAAMPVAKDFVPVSGAMSLVSSRIADLEAQETRDQRLATIPNPFGVVPVFHFANNSDVGCLGQSELVPAIPIQDGLNKSILDMLVAMEFSAFRQRWASGIEIEYNDAGEAIPPFKNGVDRLWLSSNPQTTFGEFNTTNLEQFLKVKDSFRVDMASVTGTPLHYFLQTTRSVASGESLKQNETRFLAKVRDRQDAFGQTWAELMSFALRLNGSPDVNLITHWEDPAPMSENDMLQNLLLKKRLGVSTEQALSEAGYGEIDVRRMIK